MRNKVGEAVRVIGSPEGYAVEEEALQRLRQIAALPYVVSPCIALPDLHYKSKMEAPSSVGIGVAGHIVPHLSSTSLNCGMGVIATSLQADAAFLRRVGAFFDHIRKGKGDAGYDLSRDDFHKVLEFGPRGICDRYGVQNALLDSFELGGNALAGRDYSREELLRLVPDDVLEHPEYSGLNDLGLNFSGNHFLEIQKVAEIYDDRLARRKGLQVGQVVVMYHGGGGIIPGLLGAYFSRRKKGYGDGFKVNARRFLYHLARSQPRDYAKLYLLYLKNRIFTPFPDGDSQGRRLALANCCAMNYGYAYRFQTYLRTREAMKEVYNCAGSSLITDCSHNSIFPEAMDGQTVWMHRHNSCRVREGELVPLPGFNNTSSYLCVGGKGAASSLHTMPHGAGAVIEALSRQNGLATAADRKTMIYEGNATVACERSHLCDKGIDQVRTTLEKEGIALPVVRLTPLAVLKKFC